MTDLTPDLVTQLATSVTTNTATALATIASATKPAVDAQPIIDAVAAQTTALTPVA